MATVDQLREGVKFTHRKFVDAMESLHFERQLHWVLIIALDNRGKLTKRLARHWESLDEEITYFIEVAHALYNELMRLERGERRLQQPRFELVDNETETRYVSTQVASERTGLSVQRIRQLARDERIVFEMVNDRALYVNLESIEDYLDSGKRAPGRPRKPV